MNPSQPDFWTAQHRAGRAAGRSRPGRRRRWRRSERARQAHRPRAAATNSMEQTDISIKYLRNQKLPDGQRGGQLQPGGSCGGTQQRIYDDSAGGGSRCRARSCRSAASATPSATSSATIQDLERAAPGRAIRSAPAPRRRRSRRPGAARAGRSRASRARAPDHGRRCATPARQVAHEPEAGRGHAARRASSPSAGSKPKRRGSPSACRRRSSCSRRSATWRRPALTELNAIIAYNRSLVDFEAVQEVPLADRSADGSPGARTGDDGSSERLKRVNGAESKMQRDRAPAFGRRSAARSHALSVSSPCTRSSVVNSCPPCSP